MFLDAVPTAMPDDETTAVDDLTLDESGDRHDATPDPLDHEPTRALVRGWAVCQEVAGQSTIQIPTHAIPTARLVVAECLDMDAIPVPIDAPPDPDLEARFLALCRLVHLAEQDGWNGPGYDPQRDAPRGDRRPIRRPRPYDGTAIGSELDVMRVDPDATGHPTAIRFTVSAWPLFVRWMRQRVADGFADLPDLAPAHRAFLLQFAETMPLHRPHADHGQHVVITAA